MGWAWRKVILFGLKAFIKLENWSPILAGNELPIISSNTIPQASFSLLHLKKSSMELKKFLSIHILCVLIFVGFLYYFTIFIFLDDLLSLQSSAGKFHSFFFTFMACLCVFSFFVCVLKDPGGVPFSYLPDVEDHEASDQESKRSVSLLVIKNCVF